MFVILCVYVCGGWGGALLFLIRKHYKKIRDGDGDSANAVDTTIAEGARRRATQW